MSIGRFFVTFTVIIGLFLFAFGTGSLYYINHINDIPLFDHQQSDQDPSDDEFDPNRPNSSVGDLLDRTAHPINFLLLVGDYDESNTDFMALVNYNPKDRMFSVLSIPRDTRVTGIDVPYPKVNALYHQRNGEQLVVETLSALLKVNIKYYVYTNLRTFREIIDALGGVTIDVPVDLVYDDPLQNLHINIPKGTQVLDGEQSEHYLRYRKPNYGRYTQELLQHYDGSDLKRIQAQQNYLRALIEQKANLFYVTKVNQILETIFNNLRTNANMDDILNLASSIPGISQDRVRFFTLPGSVDHTGSFYLMNEQRTSDIIAEYFYSRGSVIFDESEIGVGAG